MRVSNEAWTKIFSDYFADHDFESSPGTLTADMIKQSTAQFSKTSDREVRLLTKIDARESLPEILRDRELFILPIRNGVYILIKGEGFYNLTPARNQCLLRQCSILN